MMSGAKRAWAPPRLEVYGTVVDLTQGGPIPKKVGPGDAIIYSDATVNIGVKPRDPKVPPVIMVVSGPMPT